MEVQWPPAREPAAQRVWQQVLRPILWQETRQTTLDRYTGYCLANNITPRDLASWQD
jgi:hypothetical protein